MAFSDYRVTPLLLFSALIVGAIITLIAAPFPQMSENVVFYLLAIIPALLLIDYFFQRYVKSNAILWISESILIVIGLAVTSQLLYG